MQNTMAKYSALQIASPGVRRVAPGGIQFPGGNNVSVRVNSDQCALSQAQLSALSDKVAMLAKLAGPAGPSSTGYSLEQGIGNGFSPTDPYNGGSISTQLVSIPDNAPGGTFYDLQFSDDDAARISGCIMLRIGVQVVPTTANGGALQTYAGLCTIGAIVNGFPIAQMSNTPLASVLPTYAGTPQDLAVPFFIKPASRVKFRLFINQTLLGAVGETSGVLVTGAFGNPAGNQAELLGNLVMGGM